MPEEKTASLQLTALPSKGVALGQVIRPSQKQRRAHAKPYSCPKRMNRRNAILSLMFLSGCTTSEHLAIAEAQVPKLHKSMNEGAFEQIWYQANTQFQNAYPKETFVALMLAAKRDLGEVRSTQRQGWRATYQGTAIEVTLNLSTKFEKGEGLETVGYRVESGSAYLTTYLLESKQFAKRSDA